MRTRLVQWMACSLNFCATNRVRAASPKPGHRWQVIDDGGIHVRKLTGGTRVFLIAYPGYGRGDYHLLAGSPAIDAGTPSGAPPRDAEGVQRPQGSGYDIGPFEFGSQAKPAWPWE